MSTINVDRLPYVNAPLHFVDADAHAAQGRPYFRGYEDPDLPSVHWINDVRQVRIYDARPLLEDSRQVPSLDREGFELHQHETKVENFYDEDAVREVYYQEVIELVKSATGAQDVLVFDHTIRGPKEKKAHRQPALNVHNDYTDSSAPQRIRDLTKDPKLLAERLANRYAFINVWRPIMPAGEKVEDHPLTLADWRSLKREDYIECDIIFRDRIGETYAIKYTEDQRFFYFPGMHRGEIIFIKVYDSLDDGKTAKFVAHSAFADPTSPQNAKPRESIEIRTIAFFGPSVHE